MKVHVKICGLRRQEDLDCAASLGVDLCGFIFAAKSPRRLAPEEAAVLDSRGMIRVGVVTDTDPDSLQRLVQTARLDMLQLHGDQTESCIRALGLPPEKIIRTLWPSRYGDVKALQEAMNRLAPMAGVFLLDAGTGGGGSGNRIALNFLKELRSPRPWIVAGGLGPANVAEVIRSCADANFYGVDLNSALEVTPGCKDTKLMQEALHSIMEASFPFYGRQSVPDAEC